jgi:hypothetical protein
MYSRWIFGSWNYVTNYMIEDRAVPLLLIQRSVPFRQVKCAPLAWTSEIGLWIENEAQIDFEWKFCGWVEITFWGIHSYRKLFGSLSVLNIWSESWDWDRLAIKSFVFWIKKDRSCDEDSLPSYCHHHPLYIPNTVSWRLQSFKRYGEEVSFTNKLFWGCNSPCGGKHLASTMRTGTDKVTAIGICVATNSNQLISGINTLSYGNTIPIVCVMDTCEDTYL